jgi:hypothetical protein
MAPIMWVSQMRCPGCVCLMAPVVRSSCSPADKCQVAAGRTTAGSTDSRSAQECLAEFVLPWILRLLLYLLSPVTLTVQQRFGTLDAWFNCPSSALKSYTRSSGTTKSCECFHAGGVSLVGEVEPGLLMESQRSFFDCGQRGMVRIYRSVVIL